MKHSGCRHRWPRLGGRRSDGQGVDQGAGTAGLFPNESQRDRQADTAGAGGAGVQPEGAAGFLDAGLVGVARDHDVLPFTFGSACKALRSWIMWIRRPPVLRFTVSGRTSAQWPRSMLLRIAVTEAMRASASR